MAKKNLSLNFGIDLVQAISIFILVLGLYISFFWFFIPFAVSVLLRRHKWSGIFLVGWFLLAYLFFALKGKPVDSLELLSIWILFIMGILLHLISWKKGSFNFVVYAPMALSICAGLALFLSQKYMGGPSSFFEWAVSQVKLSAIPAIQGLKTLPESYAGFYEKLVIPILEKGFLAWLAFVFSLIFFINSAIENMFKGSRRTTLPWKGFAYWKSNDFGLVGLVLGLLLLALHQFKPDFSSIWVVSIGWHLLILSLFPILIQGAALASYFLPRVGAFLWVIIFVLLFIEPLPVLLLAGFCDLWFDLRSKIKFEPKSE